MRLLGTFGKDERGATAMIFGLALLPLMAAAGAAVDYSRAANVRTSLQKAVDAAALSLARDANALRERDLEQRGRDFFAANFVTGMDAAIEPVSVRREGKTIRVAAKGAVDNAIMPVLGFERTAISAEAVVGWGTGKIELALVLDNTGSMRDPLGRGKTKITELKKAMNDLVDKAEAASREPGDIKIAIIPFDTKVNVGTHLSPLHVRFDGIAQSRWLSRRDRCVADRDMAGDYDVADKPAQAALAQTHYPAIACTGGLAALRPLTDRFGDLRETIKDMEPDGYTNITIGTTWGLKALSGSEPLTDAAPFGAEVEKYMIVLTDGDNTRSRFVSDERNAAVIDARTRLACKEATDTGVKLFTVLVGAGNRELLADCAGNGGTFKQVDDAAAIGDAFDALLDAILAPRLTQ